MRHDEIDQGLRNLAFDFFYWFSRFEFALKERGYLKSSAIGDRADPDWNKFVSKYRKAYALTAVGAKLIAEKPQRQIVGDLEHGFEHVLFSPNTADLDMVVAYAKTIRNNLFHGGKHGSNYWDDPERMKRLLGTTITVLQELAHLGDFEEDFARYY
jgi:hypothetical protein